MKNITADLQNTVRENEHITEVYFTASGKHYFNVHQHGGEKYGRMATEAAQDVNGMGTSIAAPLEKERITETLTRDEVLNAKVNTTVARGEGPAEPALTAEEDEAAKKGGKK